LKKESFYQSNNKTDVHVVGKQTGVQVMICDTD